MPTALRGHGSTISRVLYPRHCVSIGARATVEDSPGAMPTALRGHGSTISRVPFPRHCVSIGARATVEDSLQSRAADYAGRRHGL